MGSPITCPACGKGTKAKTVDISGHSGVGKKDFFGCSCGASGVLPRPNHGNSGTPMKRSELIEKLMSTAPDDMDPEVNICTFPDNLLKIDEIDMNREEDGIVVWVV